MYNVILLFQHYFLIKNQTKLIYKHLKFKNYDYILL